MLLHGMRLQLCIGQLCNDSAPLPPQIRAVLLQMGCGISKYQLSCLGGCLLVYSPACALHYASSAAAALSALRAPAACRKKVC